MRFLPTWMAAIAMAAFALTDLVPAAENRSGEAPFDLTSGPVTTVPRPLRIDREANLTTLYHPRGWRPATGYDTAGVALVGCRDEGLQQVVWVGMPMSEQALAKARTAIRDEGTRRYGGPKPGPTEDSEIWLGGPALLASREAPDGEHELVMTAVGPGYAACSEAHRAATGHAASAHFAGLFGGDIP